MNTAKCRSCGAEIIWCKTTSGKSMPVDVAPAKGGTIEIVDGIAEIAGEVKRDQSDAGLVPFLHKSHFATCPDAAKHRRTS